MSMKTKQSSRAMLVTLVWPGHNVHLDLSLYPGLFLHKNVVWWLIFMKRPVGSGGPCRVDGENWAWIKKLYLFYVLSRIPLISQEFLVLHTTLNTTVLIYSVLLRCFFFIYLTGFIPCEQSEGPSSIFYSSWQEKMAEYYFLLIIYFM